MPSSARAAFCRPFDAFRLDSSGSLRMSIEVFGSLGTSSGLAMHYSGWPFTTAAAYTLIDRPPHCGDYLLVLLI